MSLGFTPELPERFDDMQETPGQSRLADGKLSAAGVDWKVSFIGEIARSDEFSSLAFLAIAEVFDLNHDRDRIVIIDFKKVDILAVHFAEDAIADHLHAESRLVGQHIGDL